MWIHANNETNNLLTVVSVCTVSHTSWLLTSPEKYKVNIGFYEPFHTTKLMTSNAARIQYSPRYPCWICTGPIFFRRLFFIPLQVLVFSFVFGRGGGVGWGGCFGIRFYVQYAPFCKCTSPTLKKAKLWNKSAELFSQRVRDPWEIITPCV